eukprot:1829613-Amphidinium_carterae.1
MLAQTSSKLVPLSQPFLGRGEDQMHSANMATVATLAPSDVFVSLFIGRNTKLHLLRQTEQLLNEYELP